MPARYLIVNADDFGQCREVNDGIIEAHERGIVTSASLMVRWPAAREAAAESGRYTNLSLGLHIDLGEWVHEEENWQPVYEVVSTHDALVVEREIREQLETFFRLVGRLPTHLDSHQHVHRNEPACSILIGLAREIGVPVRHYDPRIRYCGEFYGQTSTGASAEENITVGSLERILRSIPPGLTELACHPARGSHPQSSYSREREQELEVLCDPRVRAGLRAEGISLVSFREMPCELKSTGPT